MITWPIVKTFLGGLPWKNIILGLLIAGAVFFVFNYIKTAEGNRHKVVELEGANAELTKANADLLAEHDRQIKVLQGNIAASRKREKDYAENIRILRAGPDSSCALDSPSISQSLRMRYERRPRDASR